MPVRLMPNTSARESSADACRQEPVFDDGFENVLIDLLVAAQGRAGQGRLVRNEGVHGSARQWAWG